MTKEKFAEIYGIPVEDVIEVKVDVGEWVKSNSVVHLSE